MEVIRAIEGRRSCRSFRPEPMPQATIEAVLAHAAAAPSAVNLQPWRVWVAGGEELDRLKTALLKAYRERGIGCSPETGASSGQQRAARERATAEDWGPGSFRRFGQLVGERGEDFGTFINEGSCRLYGAPVGVFCFLEPGEAAPRLLDCGVWLAYLLLGAHAEGLATCPVGLLAAYADVVRDVLFVPDDYEFACAAALGHPREDDPINRVASPRRGIGTVQWVF